MDVSDWSIRLLNPTSVTMKYLDHISCLLNEFMFVVEITKKLEGFLLFNKEFCCTAKCFVSG